MAKVDPVVPEGGNAISPSGKKKQTAPWYRACFRLSNYTQEDIENFISSSSSIVPKMCFQEEDGRPKNPGGTPHLQGFVVFAPKKKYRPVQLFKQWIGHDRTNWRKMKGSVASNIGYCSDPVKRIPGGICYSRGLPKATVKMTRELARPLQLEIADKYIKNEDPLFGRELHWYYEEKGNWGKSMTALYMIDQMGATEVSGAKKDVCFGIQKLIETHGQCPPIVIVDIPRDGAKYVSYAGLEKIKDGKFFSEKYESGMARFNKPHIICFANTPPQWECMSLDRWRVFDVNKSVTKEIQQEDTW